MTATSFGTTVRVTLVPGVALEKKVRERIVADPQVTTFADLPAALRDQIWNRAVDRAVAGAKAEIAAHGQPEPVRHYVNPPPP